MKRRQIVKLFSGIPLLSPLQLLSTLVGGSALLTGCASGKAKLNSALMLQLSELHDPRFDDFAKSMSTSTIIASLTAKGIYDLEHNILDIEKIGKVAKTDEMIVLFDLYYTQTEAEVHALASIVMNKFARDNGIEPAEAYREYVEILPKVDLKAGDLRGFRTSTGLDECVEACETNEKCKAFTFAKYTHPNDKKKNMCWLKKEKFIYSTSGKEHYVSGIKP